MQEYLRVYLQGCVSVQGNFEFVQKVMAVIWRKCNQEAKKALQIGELAHGDERTRGKIVWGNFIVQWNMVKELIRELIFSCVFCVYKKVQKISDFLRFMDILKKNHKSKGLCKYCVCEQHGHKKSKYQAVSL